MIQSRKPEKNAKVPMKILFHYLPFPMEIKPGKCTAKEKIMERDSKGEGVERKKRVKVETAESL